MSAMDVICTFHEGKYFCTPFYVSFPTYSLWQQPMPERVSMIVNFKPMHGVVLQKEAAGAVFFEGRGHKGDKRIPSQDILKMMDLKKGENTMMFTAETTLQTVVAKIFLWDVNEKIVVTDIDGTITRSDKRGLWYSALGMHWHHTSVPVCFQKIQSLGYQILYLTARTMVIDGRTRKYLSELGLPSGPLLMSHKGIVDCIASEMLIKDTRVEKLTHLTHIRGLFPRSNQIPIVAGFGNCEGDEWAYREAGVPADHIFIVNKKSEIMVAKAVISYEVVSTEISKFFTSLVEKLKHSSELQPPSPHMLLGTGTR